MSDENRFLITYALHNFVSHSRVGGKCTFIIKNQGNQKMIRHAKSLIAGSYGDTANILVS